MCEICILIIHGTCLTFPIVKKIVFVDLDARVLYNYVLMTLCYRYENQEIALNCGMMLRECCRYEALAKIMLFSPEFYSFFDYVEVSTFDIASDAFSTFKVIFKIFNKSIHKCTP